MNSFIPISPADIQQNMIKLISDDWMLISAGTENKWNTMTASWGGLGFMWNEPSAFIFVRPQRYTLEFIETYDTFSLCFFDKEYKKMLGIAGSKSGRDIDKMNELGLIPKYEDGTVYFDQAKIVLLCKKTFAKNIDESCIIDKSLTDKFYTANDYHKMFIGQILKAYTK